jgi:signal transduction histidine kinase
MPYSYLFQLSHIRYGPRLLDVSSIPQRQDRPLPVLAEELRTALTPVLGYLDLMLDADFEHGSAQQLQWIGSVERQLHSLRSLSEELIEFCGEYRNGSPEIKLRLERRPE